MDVDLSIQASMSTIHYVKWKTFVRFMTSYPANESTDVLSKAKAIVQLSVRVQCNPNWCTFQLLHRKVDDPLYSVEIDHSEQENSSFMFVYV